MAALPESSLIAIFIRGLHPRYRMAIQAAGPSTFSEAVSQVEAMAAFEDPIRSYDKGPEPQRDIEFGRPQAGWFQINCSYCSKVGHTGQQCRKRARDELWNRDYSNRGWDQGAPQHGNSTSNHGAGPYNSNKSNNAYNNKNFKPVKDNGDDRDRSSQYGKRALVGVVGAQDTRFGQEPTGDQQHSVWNVTSGTKGDGDGLAWRATPGTFEQ